MQFDLRTCRDSTRLGHAHQQYKALASEAAYLQAMQGSNYIVPMAGMLLHEAVGGGQAFGGIAMSVAAGGSVLDAANTYCDR